jgi:hypothetical protein
VKNAPAPAAVRAAFVRERAGLIVNLPRGLCVKPPLTQSLYTPRVARKPLVNLASSCLGANKLFGLAERSRFTPYRGPGIGAAFSCRSSPPVQ